uniref:DNA primase AEP n=1 Tax=Monodelphis domestica TaxID=13616 RepID=A0A5F8H1R6_MONDO
FCCSSVCSKCWTLVTMVIYIINRALKEDFKFKHCLWVCSRRIGVHCWICDDAFRKLCSAFCSGIVEYLIHLGTKIHPFLRKSINIVEKYFEDYALAGQDILENKENWDKILTLIPESLHHWEYLKKVASKNRPVRNEKFVPWVECEIMLQYYFPCLHINVSKGMNHLLKSPFNIHPKTGRISVPTDLQKVDQFDPFAVPTISQICHELVVVSTSEEDGNKENKVEAEVKPCRRDYKKTSLAPYVRSFEQFLEKLDKSRKGELLRKRDTQRLLKSTPKDFPGRGRVCP